MVGFRVCKAFVFRPGYVEVCFVALCEFVVGEGFEGSVGGGVVTILRVEGFYEFLWVFVAEWGLSVKC